MTSASYDNHSASRETEEKLAPIKLGGLSRMFVGCDALGGRGGQEEMGRTDEELTSDFCFLLRGPFARGNY